MTKRVLSTFALFASAFPLSGPRFGSTKLAAVATRGALILAVLSAVLLIAARPAQAQAPSWITLFSFNGTDGADPNGRLTFDSAGNLYGTTEYGGTGTYCGPGVGCGNVFELSPEQGRGWNETVLYSFCSAPNCTDGIGPRYSYVVFDSAGNPLRNDGPGRRKRGRGRVRT